MEEVSREHMIWYLVKVAYPRKHMFSFASGPKMFKAELEDQSSTVLTLLYESARKEEKKRQGQIKIKR